MNERSDLCVSGASPGILDTRNVLRLRANTSGYDCALRTTNSLLSHRDSYSADTEATFKTGWRLANCAFLVLW